MKTILILVYSLVVTGICYAREGGSSGGGGPASIMAASSNGIYERGEVDGEPHTTLNPFTISIRRNLIEDLQLNNGTILTAIELTRSGNLSQDAVLETKNHFLFNLKSPIRDIMLKNGELIDLVELREEVENRLSEEI